MPNTEKDDEPMAQNEEVDLLLNSEDHENEVEHPTDNEEPIQDDETSDEPDLEDAVDDIVEKEGDTVLAAEDAELNKAFNDTEQKGWKQKLSHLFHQWWDNKRLRYASLAGMASLLVFLVLLPPSRYFMLNTVGVRSKASMVIYDQSTRSPLKNATVTLGSVQARTNSDGKVELSKVRLGKQKLLVQKRAFADVSKSITVGWGSNPLGNFDIKPVGAQYTFYVTDWLSGKPVKGAEANSGEFDASADDEGTIVLTIDANDDEDLPVTIKADDYRTESIKLDLSTKKGVDVAMVAGRKAVFVSKQSGRYDLYKIDVDGKNEELVLAGKGTENENMTIVSHPKDEVTAFVSTRDNVRNKDGYLLSTLNIIDLEDNGAKSVAQSEDIRVIGWSSDRLIFVQIAAGASASNPKRQRLISYNYKTEEKTELHSSNYINDVILAGNTVYYAPGNYYNTTAAKNVYKQNVDGSNKSAILAKEAWNLFRTEYDQITLSVEDEWYGYAIGSDKAIRSSSAPSNVVNRQYISSIDAKQALWSEERDGKGTLLVYDVASEKDAVLKSQAGLQSPLRWLNNHTVIYRTQTPTESADYIMSTNGGAAKKIRDVTKTIGIR